MSNTERYVVKGSKTAPGERFYVVDTTIPRGTAGRTVFTTNDRETAYGKVHELSGLCKRYIWRDTWYKGLCSRRAVIGGYCKQHAATCDGSRHE